MERMKIAALFADQEQLDGKEVTVCGWARTIRDMKTFASRICRWSCPLMS